MLSPTEYQMEGSLGVLLAVFVGWVWEYLAQHLRQRIGNHDYPRVPLQELHGDEHDPLRSKCRRCGGMDNLDRAIAGTEASLRPCAMPSADEAKKLQKLGMLLYKRHVKHKKVPDLDGAIQQFERAIDMTKTFTPRDVQDANLAIMHGDLSTFLETRYQNHGSNLSDLNKRIHHAQAAVSMTETVNPDRIILLRDVSIALVERYERVGNFQDLDAAIKTMQTCIAKHDEFSVIPREVLLEDMSNIMENKFDRSGNLGDLADAITCLQESLELTEMEDPARIARLANFSLLLFTRHQIQPCIKDLDMAIERTKEGLRLLATVSMRMPFGTTQSLMLTNLCNYFQSRYSQLQDACDLEAATEAGKAALKLIPRGDPERPGMLNNLANVLESRYARIKDAQYLRDAIRCLEEAASEVALEHRDRSVILGHLAGSLKDRFEAEHVMKDLDEAIRYAGAAVDASLNQHERGSNLQSHARFLYLRYQVTNNTTVDDLDNAIQKAKLGMNTPVVGNEKTYLRGCETLVTMLMERYKARNLVDDLSDMVHYLETALSLTPLPEPEAIIRILSNLCNVLLGRYERQRRLEDLNRVLACYVRIIELTPEDDTTLAEILVNMSSALRRRNKRLHCVEDLTGAITFAEKAVAATPPDNPARAFRLAILSSTHHDRYHGLGDANDLELAIKMMEESIAASCIGDKHHYQSLSALGILLHCRYRRYGALSDLQGAIERTSAAVQEVPETDATQRLEISQYLGTFLRARYSRDGDPHDIAEAIRHIQARLDVTVIDHPGHADLLADLGACLEMKYRKQRNISDLETAISYGEQVLQATPVDYPLPMLSRLRMLSGRYHLRYEKLGFMEDLDKSIDTLEKAVELIPEDSPDRADILIALGTDLRLRLKSTAKPSTSTDITNTNVSKIDSPHLQKRAFECFLEAWKCQTTTPLLRVQAVWRAVGYFDTFLSDEESANLLGEAVRMLPSISLRWMDEEDQQRVLSHLYGLSSLAASYTLKAGRGGFAALTILEFGRGVIMGYGIDQRSDVGEQELSSAHPELAQRLQDLRVEINSPTSAGNKGGCSVHVEPADPHDHEGHNRGQFDLNRTLEVRKMAMARFEATLAEIRKIPEYTNFLKPPTADELIQLAKNGTIVVMCCTRLRSDAITISSSGVQAFELPELDYKETKKRMRQMGREYVRGTLKTFAVRNKRMRELLLNLWKQAVRPVLIASFGAGSGDLEAQPDLAPSTPTLPCVRRTSDKLPRVWWIGVGELSKAPFHAAGDHRPGSKDNTMTHVVSSYIPNIKALASARQRLFRLGMQPRVNGESPRILLVAMPTTPGKAPLRRVEQEVEAIMRVFEPPYSEPPTGGCKGIVQHPEYTVRPLTTPLSQPTAAAVLSYLPHYDIAHFACHGVSDGINPFQSHLLLARPTTGQTTTLVAETNSSSIGETLIVDKLTALDISRLYSSDSGIRSNAGLSIAYLSACCTADNPAIDLADESIHLASAFQVAGFSHVLATLWQGQDDACTAVAQLFYQGLFRSSREGNGAVGKDGFGVLEEGPEDNSAHSTVARAMHEAVCSLRVAKGDKPLIWAPFIHTGA